MQDVEVECLRERVDAAATHACRALLVLESLRRSTDPVMRTAYIELHDLLGDLGSLRISLDLMVDEPPARPRHCVEAGPQVTHG